MGWGVDLDWRGGIKNRGWVVWRTAIRGGIVWKGWRVWRRESARVGIGTAKFLNVETDWANINWFQE